MPDYRAYIFDHDEHIVGFEPIVCADDAKATEKAKQLVNGHDIELWSGTRLVGKFGHKPAKQEL